MLIVCKAYRRFTPKEKEKIIDAICFSFVLRVCQTKLYLAPSRPPRNVSNERKMRNTFFPFSRCYLQNKYVSRKYFPHAKFLDSRDPI